VYAPYFFNIGSVESFERKLESVQVRGRAGREGGVKGGRLP